VAIEIPHGPVVQTLVDAGVKVFALNPKQLDRYRDRFTVAGAKDDRRDAHVLASALRTDRHAFWPVSLDSAEWAQLREESRHYEELRGDFTRLTNRLRQLVGRCFAPLLSIGDVTEPWMWDILKRPLGPKGMRKLGQSTIERILARHRIKRISAKELQGTLCARSFPPGSWSAGGGAAHPCATPPTEAAAGATETERAEAGPITATLRPEEPWCLPVVSLGAAPERTQ
jgi:hypothetical protein